MSPGGSAGSVAAVAPRRPLRPAAAKSASSMGAPVAKRPNTSSRCAFHVSAHDTS
jgi:hypothetical protein